MTTMGRLVSMQFNNWMMLLTVVVPVAYWTVQAIKRVIR